MARKPNSMRKGTKVAIATPKRKKSTNGKAIPSDVNQRYKVAKRKTSTRRA